MDTPLNTLSMLPCNSFPPTTSRQFFALPVINELVSLSNLLQLLCHQNVLFAYLKFGSFHDLFRQLKRDHFFLLGRAEKNDLVLIAGKGHENYQILGMQKEHFDDREVARDCLRKQVH